MNQNPERRVNQTVGMVAKHVFPKLFAHYVKVQTLPFEKAFANVDRIKLTPTLLSVIPVKRVLTGIKQL